jgi:hypothetical protein
MRRGMVLCLLMLAGGAGAVGLSGAGSSRGGDSGWDLPASNPRALNFRALNLRGRLRIADDCFRDDTGCVNPIYAHAGDLFSVYVRDRDRAILELDAVAGAGYHGLRVWSTLGCEGGPCADASGYWHGREVGPKLTPDYWGHIERFFRDVGERRMRLVWSQGDIRALEPRHEAMARFAHLDNAVGGVIDWIDCGNEAYATGEPDPRRLAECVRAYQEAGGRALKTLTDAPVHVSPDSTVTLDAYSLSPADAFDVHSFRGGHSWEKRRYAWGYTYENAPRLGFGLSSEPPGSGRRVSVVENQDELDDEAVALLALGSILGRQAHVWFSGEGVMIDRGLSVEAGFISTPRAVKLLPRDVMTYGTSHHSGERWESLRVLEAIGEVRVDGRQHADGRFAYTIDGPPGKYTLRVARGFAGQLCHPGTGACEDIAVASGESLEVDFTRGRLFVGRVR